MPKYVVIREIGRGGFGVVEEVVDSNGNHFARKRFQPAPHNLPHNPTEAKKVLDRLRQRFTREVKTQQALTGPEIMPVLDSGLGIENPWFVMPLAEKSYDQQIADDRSSGVITIEAVADIMNGLQYLHDLGYVHRDLNPRNVLLYNGHWCLTDFGAVLPPQGQTLTLTENTTIYTELYCSPEQHNEFHKAQPPSDIYSFGCILHDLVGKPPRTPYGKHTADGKLGVIIEKCTDRTPKRRPSILPLRDMVLEALVEAGGHLKIDDPQSEEWLAKIETIDQWNESEFEDFLRFFMNLDKSARTEAHLTWVGSYSTPFLSHLSTDALAKISARKDSLSEAIVESYSEWARTTNFSFGFSDSIASRLCAIYDNGTNADKACAFAALVELGSSHNRWYVMRAALLRGGRDISDELANRLAIELRTCDLVGDFQNCVNVIAWQKSLLCHALASLL
ncbi:MAG: serine/threonine-protein kinase [Pirellulales bacterium]